ncbi:exocyst complex component 1 isoform X2 [Daktulosphaira vitifoliae]|uniref:exocyst complex component 1 isoform X2 n=1 Tax=Daktulosphaira vitifoliae TaxID=58002 RepID=UPI0021AAF255|nr:exocyst complex component 1 isoform X2 [Daktulosphaira vitifoliae]
MATPRQILQQEIFDQCDQKLLAFVGISNDSKKKKFGYLCLTDTKDLPSNIFIHQIKFDKHVVKKKRMWPLHELIVVDGKSSSQDCLEIELMLDKLYKWLATNYQERKIFLISLWKQCANCVFEKKTEFKNLPLDWTSGDLLVLPADRKSKITLATSPIISAEDFQPLSEKEEQDLELLMKECGFASKDAKAFTDMLANQLMALDGENIQSVLASEPQVTKLMDQLETAIQEIEIVESALDSYDETLRHVRDTIDKMDQKNANIQTANKNNEKLLNELQQVIYQLELSPKHQLALTDADLTSSSGLRDAIAAAKELQAVMNAQIHPALVRLKAIQEQRKRFDKWKAKFSQILSRHLNNLFIHMGNDIGETKKNSNGDLTIMKHTSLHCELAAYTELMHWCKAMDRKAFLALSKVYTTSLSKLYERDIKSFLDDAKLRVNAGNLSNSKEDIRRSTGPPSDWLLGIDKELWAQESDTQERQRFDQVLEAVLSELEPICLSEQNFCVSFFQLDVPSSTSKNTQTTLDGTDIKSNIELSIPKTRIEKKMNEEVRKMMSEIFASIEPELISFIQYHERMDSTYSMAVLVRLGRHVMSANDTGSFLSMTYGSALVHVKRNYDKLMNAHLKSIQDIRIAKKSKCGILPFVANFEYFAKTAEQIFKETDRRTDLDKWYVKLISAMFDTIILVSNEHPKTPAEVIRMENFHHLYALLSQLKIHTLDQYRKDARQKYSEALSAYVTRYFGRPLEKLNLFFEGVQAKVAQGIKESEIGYQVAFSKQELRKMTKEYHGREVKKGLDHLYKKVEKHLSEEENLLQLNINYRSYGELCKKSLFGNINT